MHLLNKVAMNKQIFSIVLLLLALVMPQSAAASSSSEDGKVDLKGIIFHTLVTVMDGKFHSLTLAESHCLLS